MEDKKLTIKEFIEQYPNNKKKDRKTMIYFGWNDWFCAEVELSRRLDLMYPVIKETINILEINNDNFTYYLKEVGADVTFDRIGFLDINNDGEQVFIIDFPTYMGSGRFEDERSTYTLYSCLNYLEPIIDEHNLSFFYHKVRIHKEEILLPLQLK